MTNDDVIIIFSFNIQSDIPQYVYKYERMIAGYYRSRIYPQGSHARRNITSHRQLWVKELYAFQLYWHDFPQWLFVVQFATWEILFLLRFLVKSGGFVEQLSISKSVDICIRYWLKLIFYFRIRFLVSCGTCLVSTRSDTLPWKNSLWTFFVWRRKEPTWRVNVLPQSLPSDEPQHVGMMDCGKLTDDEKYLLFSPTAMNACQVIGNCRVIKTGCQWTAEFLKSVLNLLLDVWPTAVGDCGS